MNPRIKSMNDNRNVDSQTSVYKYVRDGFSLHITIDLVPLNPSSWKLENGKQ